MLELQRSLLVAWCYFTVYVRGRLIPCFCSFRICLERITGLGTSLELTPNFLGVKTRIPKSDGSVFQLGNDVIGLLAGPADEGHFVGYAVFQHESLAHVPLDRTSLHVVYRFSATVCLSGRPLTEGYLLANCISCLLRIGPVVVSIRRIIASYILHASVISILQRW